MKRLIEQRYIVRQNFIAIIGICLSVYFCYHLVAGERGYLRFMSLERQIAAAEQTYDTLTAQRSAIEEKVVMMRPGSINRDLLEERARVVLGYRYTDEKILPITGRKS
jgi:cell division protein FtsB